MSLINSRNSGTGVDLEDDTCALPLFFSLYTPITTYLIHTYYCTCVWRVDKEKNREGTHTTHVTLSQVRVGVTWNDTCRVREIILGRFKIKKCHVELSPEGAGVATLDPTPPVHDLSWILYLSMT